MYLCGHINLRRQLVRRAGSHELRIREIAQRVAAHAASGYTEAERTLRIPRSLRHLVKRAA